MLCYVYLSTTTKWPKRCYHRANAARWAGRGEFIGAICHFSVADAHSGAVTPGRTLWFCGCQAWLAQSGLGRAQGGAEWPPGHPLALLYPSCCWRTRQLQSRTWHTPNARKEVAEDKAWWFPAYAVLSAGSGFKSHSATA